MITGDFVDHLAGIHGDRGAQVLVPDIVGRPVILVFFFVAVVVVEMKTVRGPAPIIEPVTNAFAA
ncbi:MAG TPA: hypothetical protein VH333_01980, partial [Pseudonocardiaceae bacterium]|nr:hypothetical protein [Pseudonocardiaceae bacterium]